MPYLHRDRTERLIAIGRVVLAGLSIVTVALEPDLVQHYVGSAYALMLGFLVYSVAVVMEVTRSDNLVARHPVVLQVLDIAWISALVLLTDGETSPFVVYLAFALVAGTMRWQWRGAVWTGAALVVMLVAVLGVHSLVSDDHDLALDHILVLCVYTIVLAALLGYLGLHEQRALQEVGRLAAWSSEWEPGADDESRLSDFLAHATDTMDAKQSLLVWDDEREPWLRLAYWDGSTTEFSRASPTEYEPLVVDLLADATFICRGARAGTGARALYKTNQGMTRYQGVCLSPALADRFEIDDVVSAPLEVDGNAGRVFFLGMPQTSDEDLALASVVGRAVSVFMGEVRLRTQLRESVAFEERVRLARDIHDGVLQSLTGTALQLEAARRLLDRDLPEARHAIAGVQGSLVQQQRELRLLVDTLDPNRKPQVTGASLATRLNELVESLSRQWGVQTAVDMDEAAGLRLAHSPDLAQDVIFIVHEGLVNSCRHAGATRSTATIRFANSSIEISVDDDGRGFGFEGRRDAVTLRSQGIGPMALISRMERLRGTLWVTSGPEGSRVEISLPLASAPDGHRSMEGSDRMGANAQPTEAV
jgi:signal transduction histidine kinase